MKNLYSEKVLEHFKNPQNMGEIKNADGMATVGNPVCGDIMRLYIKVKDNRLEDVKFQTLGCAAAIASSSMLTVMAKGKTLEEAKKISREDVARELGDLPPSKIHCSILAVDALKKAIEDYRQKK